nr:MAG TPA: hypothetical protein [Caudoviricetes sp.]
MKSITIMITDMNRFQISPAYSKYKEKNINLSS